MKERYASIIEQLKWIPISYRHDGLQGIVNELRLLFTGKSVRCKGKVKVIDTTFAKYRNYKAKSGESLTLLYRSYGGKKAAIHFGVNNPWNWMPKFIQMKLRSRGDLPKTHIIKGWED